MKDGVWSCYAQSSKFQSSALLQFLDGFLIRVKNSKIENLKRHAKLSKKLKDHHREWMVKVLADENTTRWIRTKLKNKLVNEFIDIPKFSDSTIGRFLKDELRWSYKKREMKAVPTLTQVSWRKLLEGGMIQHKLISKNIETIYMDEFTVNIRDYHLEDGPEKEIKGISKLIAKILHDVYLRSICKKILRNYGIRRDHHLSGSEAFESFQNREKYFEMTMIRILSWCLIMQECTQASRQINSSQAQN